MEQPQVHAWTCTTLRLLVMLRSSLEGQELAGRALGQDAVWQRAHLRPPPGCVSWMGMLTPAAQAAQTSANGMGTGATAWQPRGWAGDRLSVA